MGQRAAAARGDLGARWAGSAHEVFLGLREWRALHPTATLAAIEGELDRRWAVLRGQLLAALALARAAASVTSGAAGCCPECGGVLRDEGVRRRTLITTGQAPITLSRDYTTYVQCGRRSSPLDAELGLRPNHRFTPRIEELLARLGSTVSFAEARGAAPRAGRHRQRGDRSYAARWEPAESFGATITLEAQRRGIDEAHTVVSPNDGAEWDPA